MSLDISKLENVRIRGKKITARCPVCAKSGNDRRGEHLIVDADGPFGCVVYPGPSPDAKAHREQIFALCGCRKIKPLCVHAAGGAEFPGRSGRVVESQGAVEPLKTGLLGRLGRLFQTHLESGPRNEGDVFPDREINDNERGVLPVLEPSVRPNRPLTERELQLLRHAGMENNPVIIAAVSLFNGTIVGVQNRFDGKVTARAKLNQHTIAPSVKHECAINKTQTRKSPTCYKTGRSNT